MVKKDSCSQLPTTRPGDKVVRRFRKPRNKIYRLYCRISGISKDTVRWLSRRK